MRNHLTLIRIFFSISVILPFSGIAQQKSSILNFHTSKDWKVTVENRTIRINGKELYRFKDDIIIYESKRNRLIEDGGAVFLFLEINGSPNLDRLYAFHLAENKVELLADAISSDLKDLDHDSFLEFGGSNLTEEHPSRDSMYYIPFDYYEIREGRVIYDSLYSKAVAKVENGVYLPYPLDEHGFCCKVIRKPGKKNTSILVDTSLVSERIDGPANVRDTVDGKLLFRLSDNVPVSTSDTVNKWYRIGLHIDLDPAQLLSLTILKGSPLFANGVLIGRALETIQVQRVDEWNKPSKGILKGYMAMNNIKSQTIPEKLLSRIIRLNGSMDVSDLDFFQQAFGLSVIMDHPYKGLYLDGSPLVYNGAYPPRIMLIFNGRRLYAVIHSRKMEYHGSKEYALHGGYILTVVGLQEQKLIDKLVKDFNSFHR